MNSASVGLQVNEAKSHFKNAKAVFFDVDSTVIQEEGIDVLANFANVKDAVEELTRKAMGGSVLFQDALTERLSLIQPSESLVQQCLQKHPFRLTPNVKRVIDLLHARGTHVFLVSGGFRQMINPIAAQLNIPSHRIFANNILFSATTREYAGFDPNEPTSRDGGKKAVLSRLVELHGYTSAVMIGDGATDMQAKSLGAANAFIGFGGVVEREKVKEGADWFIYDFEDLVHLLLESNEK